MSIRSTYIFWPQALREPERLLDDISRFTNINTIELDQCYSPPASAEGSPGLGSRPRPVIASAKAFEGIRIPIVSRRELASIRRFILLAKSRGFKVACNFCPVHVPTRERLSMACVDVMGSRVEPAISPPQPIVSPSKVYGCPNNPELAKFSETMMKEVVESWAPADIITLNAVEYPTWPGRKGDCYQIENLFSCFCRSCEEKARRDGIDFDEMKREVESLYNSLSSRRPRGPNLRPDISAADVLNTLAERPALAVWLHFRTRSVTEFVKEVVRAGREAAREHNPGLQIGLEFQLPTLSYLVGTDYAELAPYFDFLVPKFPDYIVGNAIPIVSDTIAERTGVARSPEISRMIRGLLDLGPGPKEYRRYAKPGDMLYDVGLEAPMIDRQIKHLAPVMGKVPLYPYLWLGEGNVRRLREKIRALKKNGIDGYFIKQWEPDLSRKALSARRGIY